MRNNIVVAIFCVCALIISVSGLSCTTGKDLGNIASGKEECFRRGVDNQPAFLETVKVAEKFIQDANVRFNTVKLHDAGLPPMDMVLARKGKVSGTAVVSYPGIRTGHLAGMSFMQDDALALIWFASNGNREAARSLAKTLMSLQNSDGSFGYSFSTGSDGFYNMRYIKTGVVAWAAYALLYYGFSMDDSRAVDASAKAINFIKEMQNLESGGPEYGLVRSGFGSWSQGYSEFDPCYLEKEYMTTNQFVSDMLFKASGVTGVRAGLIEDGLMSRMWLDQEGRFAEGSFESGMDVRRSLNAAGAWGALWLVMTGNNPAALKSYTYSAAEFKNIHGPVTGYKPFLDKFNGLGGEDVTDVISLEGTFAMGLAAFRLGDRVAAQKALDLGSAMQCLAGPGMPYTSRDAGDLRASPSVSSTLWFLFLEREFSGKGKAPLFNIERKM